MPTYNSGVYLSDSIESVLDQTYGNLELLITDDCSSDEQTQQILQYYQQKDPRVKVFLFDENQGPAVARNHAIEQAQGRYIAFCDSDDRWLPEKLEKQVSLLSQNNYCLVFSSYLKCDAKGNPCGIVMAPTSISLSGLKRDNKIGCLTAIYDTKPYGKFYMPTIRKRQDWALFLNILKKCRTAYALQEPLALYRKTPESISRKKFALLKYNAQVYQTVFGYSKAKSYAYLYGIFLPSYFTKLLSNKLVSMAHKDEFSQNQTSNPQ